MNETMIEKGFTEPTDRVKRLKKMIVEARPMVETYRAQLVTQTYKETEGMTAIMRRAKVDENLFNNLPIVIRDEELIVGSPCVHRVPRTWAWSIRMRIWPPSWRRCRRERATSSTFPKRTRKWCATLMTTGRATR